LSLKLAGVQEFAKETGISQDCKVKIREAVKYNAYRMGNVWSDKHSLFSELPKALRHEVAWSMYGGVAKEFPIFTLFEQSFLTTLMPLFRPFKSTDGESIYREGDYADEMFFIVHGRVNFVLPYSEIVYKSFLRGSYIGEIEIFKKTTRINIAVCCGECEFLVLSKFDLLQVLTDFPAEAKELRKIAFERGNRNKQAYLETLELVKLKAKYGSLTELAGQHRILEVENEIDKELPVVEQMRDRLNQLEDEVRGNSTGILELTAVVFSTKKLLAEALRRTESLQYRRPVIPEGDE
jgi:CRP-like cAMP-binding protein